MIRRTSRMPLLSHSVPGEEGPNSGMSRTQSTYYANPRTSAITGVRNKVSPPSRQAGKSTLHNPPPVSSLRTSRTAHNYERAHNVHMISLQTVQQLSVHEGNQTGFDDIRSASFQANLFTSDDFKDRHHYNSDFFGSQNIDFNGNRNVKKSDSDVLHRTRSMQNIPPSHGVMMNRHASFHIPVAKNKPRRLPTGYGSFSRGASVPPSFGNISLPSRPNIPGRSLTGIQPRNRKHEPGYQEGDKQRKVVKSPTKHEDGNLAMNNENKGYSWFKLFFLLTVTILLLVFLAILLVNQKVIVHEEISLSLSLSRTTPVEVNTTGLESVLQKSVFGQHLALDLVPKVIINYINEDKSSKPLVLSLHGGVGTGKTLLTENLATHLFKKQKLAKCSHRFISSMDFPNVDKTEEYKTDIMKVINSKSQNGCRVGFFIFDEIDNIPLGLLPTLVKMMSTLGENTKSIYILESNLFSEEINQLMVQRFFQGKSFDSVTRDDVKRYIYHIAMRESNTHVYNNPDTESDQMNVYLRYTVFKSTINHLVPFLPLTKHHIKQCIEKDLIEKGYQATKEVIELVTEQMQYFPQKLQWFSVSGCKGVSLHVDLVKDWRQ